MKLVKKYKIIALGLLALLASSNALEGMAYLRSCLPWMQKRATQEQINQAKNCPICLNNFVASEQLTPLFCSSDISHIFHQECLDGWINAGKKTCPTCRAIIPMKPKTFKEMLKNNNLITRHDLKDFGILFALSLGCFSCANKVLFSNSGFSMPPFQNALLVSTSTNVLVRLVDPLNISTIKKVMLYGMGILATASLAIGEENNQFMYFGPRIFNHLSGIRK